MLTKQELKKRIAKMDLLSIQLKVKLTRITIASKNLAQQIHHNNMNFVNSTHKTISHNYKTPFS